ncbi:hypothetical protein KBJ94_23335 [Pseudomonas sp. ITA]|uniref:M50 family metallopeptidase n=1 Tax=Pseudomonas sp. ITA TaxID=2825841 RepID=UPI0024999915|nr:M50 family metallopeptidase [Pseudomonas sp. ITA]MDI2144987.1 hypothetical protein [Pseudomonas sp. ITA]
MFNYSNWQLIVQYLAYIFLMPPLVILVMDRLVQSLVRSVFPFYAVTGVLGTLIHELGHVLACWMFGLKITQIRLYSPDAATGRLGYVAFTYRPSSTVHAVGLVVQGVAPIFMAFLLFEFLFPFNPTVATWGGSGIDGTVFLEGVAGAWTLGYGNFCAGGMGPLWSLSALIIAMHCIPSWADIRLALRGGVVLLVIALAASLLFKVDFSSQLPTLLRNGLAHAQGMADAMTMRTLEWVIYAVTMVTTLAVAGVVLLLVLPTLVLIVLRRMRYGGKKQPHSVVGLDRADGSAPVAKFYGPIKRGASVETDDRTMNSGPAKNEIED